MASFMDLVGDRDRKGEQLVAAGSVVELRHRKGAAVVSARAQKLYHLLIKGVGIALTTRVPFHQVPLASVRDLAHLSNSDLKDIAEELVRTIVEVKTPGPKGATAIGGLLSFVSIDNASEGMLQFAFSEPMIRVFELDNRWTIIDRDLLLSFESKYAIRLYEMLILRGGHFSKEEEFSLIDIRDRLGVSPDKVKQFGHFKSDILEPAVNEVRRRTGRLIQWKAVKTGRAVSSIVITWPPSAGDTDRMIDALPDVPKAIRKEAAKSRMAPITRRPEKTSSVAPAAKPQVKLTEAAVASEGVPRPRTTLDDIKTADPFPLDGTICYTPWADLVRAIIRVNTPDVDIIAGQFRVFAAEKPGMLFNPVVCRRSFITFVTKHHQKMNTSLSVAKKAVSTGSSVLLNRPVLSGGRMIVGQPSKPAKRHRLLAEDQIDIEDAIAAVRQSGSAD